VVRENSPLRIRPFQRFILILALAVSAARSTAQNPDLPEQDAFLREAREALARSQQLWHRYAYKERRTDLHMNPFGRMGTGDTRVFEVRPSPDPRLTYRREIERNGVPVPKAELDRQDAEYRERVARIEREGAGRGRSDDDALAARRSQMMLEDVLRTLQFKLARRDVFAGSPAIVVAFAARPNARPVTREGRTARVFKGEVWIDEASREVRHVAAVATDDVSFGGFIAKIYEGMKAVVDREQVEPGVWMPVRLRLTGDVRALFRRAHIEHVVEWFDYRRVDSGVRGPGGQVVRGSGGQVVRGVAVSRPSRP
jgi:hypothetical protein